jgi:hypothetical protein
MTFGSKIKKALTVASFSAGAVATAVPAQAGGLEKIRSGSFTMQVPASVKPAIWGAIGGAVAAMIVGFVWGGWVTGGTAGKMVATSAEDASVLALTPLCVAKAEQQPEQLVLLKKASSYSRGDFVTKAGWVANVNEKYRSAVATACASALVEAMDAKPAG